MTLTKNDLNKIQNLVEVTVDYKLEQKLEEKLNEKVGRLPTKDDFYESMDAVMGELKAMREEVVVVGQHSADHTDILDNHEKRIKKVESIQLIP